MTLTLPATMPAVLHDLSSTDRLQLTCQGAQETLRAVPDTEGARCFSGRGGLLTPDDTGLVLGLAAVLPMTEAQGDRLDFPDEWNLRQIAQRAGFSVHACLDAELHERCRYGWNIGLPMRLHHPDGRVLWGTWWDSSDGGDGDDQTLILGGFVAASSDRPSTSFQGDIDTRTRVRKLTHRTLQALLRLQRRPEPWTDDTGTALPVTHLARTRR